MRRGGLREFGSRQAGLGPGGAGFWIDLQILHIREVQQDSALGNAVPGDAVTSAANGKLKATLPRQIDHTRDIVRIGNLDNDRRMAIHAAIEDGSRLIVICVTWSDHAVFEIFAKR